LHLSAEHGWWIVGIYVSVVVGSLIILNYVFEKRYKDKLITFFATNRLFLLITIILIVMAIISFSITTMLHTNQPSFDGVGEIRGTVRAYRIGESQFGGTWGNMTLSNVTFNGESVPGRVRITVRNLDDASIENITFGAIVQTTAELTPSEVSSFAVNNRIRYVASINGVSVDFVRDATDMRSVVMRHSYNFLHRFMSGNTATLVYSMMFGDRSTLDGEMHEDFRLIGLAHILAVSGMHVGLIVAIILIFLKLIRVERRWQFLILLVIIALYAYFGRFQNIYSSC